MLIGLYGVFAVGKTTFLFNLMDELAGLSIYGLTVVMADLGDEYEYHGGSEPYWEIRSDRKSLWRGKQDEKAEHMRFMVNDKERMWIVESARYFGGMHGVLVDAFAQAGGGLHFIVPVTDGDTGRKFLIDRCKKRNKTFRADYWTDKRLAYECIGRYQNVMSVQYGPAGVPYMVLPISYARTEWAAAEASLKHMVTVPLNKWYGKKELHNGKSGSNQRPERQRQNDNSEAVVSTITRQPYTGK